jgi:N-acylneuraminate cytidylyltransferase
MNIAIIPARSGSKRIPKKNIKPFLGKPLIAYSIEAALASPSIDQVFVTTDSHEIADIAQEYGASVPFIRDAKLADDQSSVGVALKDASTRIRQQGCEFSYVCCIYATAPTISTLDIERGLSILLETPQATQSLSVTTFPFPVQRALVKSKQGFMTPLNEELHQLRSQDLQETYHDAGQFFWFDTTNTKDYEIIAPVLIDRFKVQDIDTEEDWQVAERLYKVIQAYENE